MHLHTVHQEGRTEWYHDGNTAERWLFPHQAALISCTYQQISQVLTTTWIH